MADVLIGGAWSSGVFGAGFVPGAAVEPTDPWGASGWGSSDRWSPSGGVSVLPEAGVGDEDEDEDEDFLVDDDEDEDERFEDEDEFDDDDLLEDDDDEDDLDGDEDLDDDDL